MSTVNERAARRWRDEHERRMMHVYREIVSRLTAEANAGVIDIQTARDRWGIR